MKVWVQAEVVRTYRGGTFEVRLPPPPRPAKRRNAPRRPPSRQRAPSRESARSKTSSDGVEDEEEMEVQEDEEEDGVEEEEEEEEGSSSEEEELVALGEKLKLAADSVQSDWRWPGASE